MTDLNLLYPLDEFYRQQDRPLPQAEEMEAGAIPEPYKSLLVHARDMTPTLENYHGGSATLKLLSKRPEQDRLMRLVTLVREEDDTPLEFGAIVIYLDHFGPEAREEVLACHTPLGTILAKHSIPHHSRPQAYVRIEPDRVICSVLNIREPRPLYGRRNLLIGPDGSPLAQILEILPPQP